jgi:DNA modification methylase
MDLKIEYLRPDELTPYENNAKIHTNEQIEQIISSIKKFGFLDPVGIWKDNIIIEGHGRYEAAIKMGLEKIPVIRLDSLTDAQRKAYGLVHNQLTMSTGFDIDKLTLELEKVSLDFDMAAFGFGGGPGGSGDDALTAEEVPAEEPPKKAVTKPGEVYQLGRHRLICGDSTDPETISKLLQGAEIDLLLTDPPYNVDVGTNSRPRTDKNNVHILNDNKPEAEFVDFLSTALNNAFQAMKPGAAFYIWYAGLHHTEFDLALRKTQGARVSEQLIWAKTHFVLGKNSDYQWAHECCIYGWKEGAAHYFTDSRAERTVIEDRPLTSLKKSELVELCSRLLGDTQSTTVITEEKPTAAELHPTVKPQGLLEKLIKNSSKQGWQILDPFGGSGSTLICAEQLNRVCYMAELDPKYCDVIIARYETLTGEKAVRINDGETMENENKDRLPESGDV